MTDQLPEEVDNYLKAIDLQISSITGFTNPYGDYDHALADQVIQLQELKARVIAESSLSPASTSRKRPAETNDVLDGRSTSTDIADVQPPKQAYLQALECSACIEKNLPGDSTILKCCGTIYCKSCFCQWLSTVLATKQLPACCGVAIKPREYPLTLTRPVHIQYRVVRRELQAERKLWCANMDCQAFIKIDKDTSGFVKCTKCRRRTCASCAGGTSVHKGRRKMCPNHLKDEILESTMVKNQWKRCPRCHVVVEKSQGCNNIRCTCGVMFCFRCGISKTKEGDICKCSDPKRQFVEQVEDPASEDEAAPASLRAAYGLQG